MRAGRIVNFGVAIAAMIAGVAPDRVGAQSTHAWRKVTTKEGCSFFQWLPASFKTYERYDLHWAGTCTADRLITGKGVFKGIVKPGKEQVTETFKLTNFEAKGSFNAGVLEGEFEHCDLGSGQCNKLAYDKGCERSDKAKGCVPGSALKLTAATLPPKPPTQKTSPQPPPAPAATLTPRLPPPTPPAQPQQPDPKKQKVIAISPNKTQGCLTVITTPGSFGGFKNACNFDIDLVYCVAEIQKIPGGHWSEAFACEEGKFGGTKVKAHGQSGDHTKGGKVFWLSCPSPQIPRAYHFEKGRGILGLCK